LFSLGWSLITPAQHRFLRAGEVRLHDLTDVPLILFERGSTGRQHVMDAFHGAGLSPRVEMETTNTEIIVRMVEAGLGVSVLAPVPRGGGTRGVDCAADAQRECDARTPRRGTWAGKSNPPDSLGDFTKARREAIRR